MARYYISTRSDNMSKHFRIQSLGEEIANAISHGIGALLSVAGMVILIVTACKNDMGAMAVVSAVLYGSGLILLYTFSSIYHSLTNDKAKYVFRVFDHCSIFLLILCTIIPVALVMLGGWKGWVVFGVACACAVLGIILNAINLERWDKFSLILYVIMGWFAIIFTRSILMAVSVTDFFIWLFGGGVFYTLGIIFYRNTKYKYMHFIWHLFVLAGSIMHYFFVLNYYIK